jgi:hypothetical protein
MTPEEKLREYIRTEITACLKEISTTGNVAGYLTPRAFTGDSKSNASQIKKMASLVGYKLTDRGKDDVRAGDSLNEISDIDAPPVINAFISRNSNGNINPTGKHAYDSGASFANRMAVLVGYTVLLENYYDYKRDQSRRPHQKIGQAMDEVNRQLKLIEKVLRMNHRLKRDSRLQNEQLWKRTQEQLVKLEDRLLKLASRLREMRS